MKDSLIALSKDALFSLRDLAPIVLVIAVFQLFVIRQPILGFAIPEISLIRVVLPDPLGTIIIKKSPQLTENVISCKTGVLA